MYFYVSQCGTTLKVMNCVHYLNLIKCELKYGNFELWTVNNLEIKLENQLGAMIIYTPCCNPTMFVQ